MPRTRLASGASLAMARGVGWVGQGSNLAEDRGLRVKDILMRTRCVPGHFGQAQISRTCGRGPSVSVDDLDRTKCSARSEGETGLRKATVTPGRVAVKVHIAWLQSAVSFVTLLPQTSVRRGVLFPLESLRKEAIGAPGKCSVF